MAKQRESSGDAELDLEIRQSARFTQREWLLERVGWAVLAAFVVAGLIGAFGWGPLTTVTAVSEDGTLTVEYQTVGHHEADDSVRILVASDAAVDGKVTVELTGPWVSGVDVSSVTPAPSTEYAITEGVALEFDVEPGAETQVTIIYRASGYWGIDAHATVGDESVHFSQFVLP